MMARAWIALAAMFGAAACGVRENPPVSAAVVRPDRILDFATLYSDNCAGCHGRDGEGGAAQPLGDPIYLAIVGDPVIRNVAAKGVAGTSMPAFAVSSGGPLTDQQIDAIVTGIRGHWAKPDALNGQTPPPYAASSPGDAAQGEKVYGTYCSSCHGPNGAGGQRASSIVDPAFLTLVSDQSLRTTVIAGRPDLGSPDWRKDVPGKAMSNEDVSNVVAWLAAQRPQISARR